MALSTNRLQLHFRQLASALCDRSLPGEQMRLNFTGEQSQFIRFNQSKVRQIGTVSDGQLTLTVMIQQRSAKHTIPVTGVWDQDWMQLLDALDGLRRDAPQLPIDPFEVLPNHAAPSAATSTETHPGQIPAPKYTADLILSPVIHLDFTGLYAGGVMMRGYADSAGQYHWFSTDSFTLDYSIFTANGQAVKGTYAGRHWQPDRYLDQLDDAKQQLARLAQPAKSMPKGTYRTYFAPAALAELVSLMTQGGFSESALQCGGSALGLLKSGQKTLSPRLTIIENFSHGLVPRFNHLGEMAPAQLPLMVDGALVNTLVNSRTAKEYGAIANGANDRERARSPDVSPGHLATDQILPTLGTGLYVSNLHYLNWSDRPNGRATGMTRYACFWVEDGAIVAPIENLRFDDSIYRCFGDQLVALTDTAVFVPEVSTYDHRSLGGMWVPGAIVDEFVYTL
jgi:predicted Zn-dependent protease